MKASIQRSFNNFFDKEICQQKPIERCRLLFLLSWLHAVIMERLKYIPIGWSKHYEFSEADLRSGFEIINKYINS